jgi:hypothetical protein
MLTADLRGAAWLGGTAASGQPTSVWGLGDQAWIGGSEKLLRRGCD